MKCVIRSASGFYACDNLKPRWVQDQSEAKVFPNIRMARGVVRILTRQWIKAAIVRRDPESGGAIGR